MSQDSTVHSYKDTLQLPHTEFPIRPNHLADQIAILKRWHDELLYELTFKKNSSKKKFIIIDGPPYANGPLHLGHAYNKILKDIVAKSKRMMGFHVPVIPGWDCHGLPIELKVSQENPSLKELDLQKACRQYAQKWVNIQKEEFKNFGVLMHWEQPYLTMDYSYEGSTIEAFGELVNKGYITRKNKTIPWCYSCKTVLAAAEIEYQDRTDPSTYILYQITNETIQKIFSDFGSKENKSFYCVVWTTTPWTTLLVRAIVSKPDTQYVIIKTKEKYLIVAKELAHSFASKTKIDCNIVFEFSSKKFNHFESFVINPLVQSINIPIIVDSSVLINEGTAFVSNAPGAGPEDYEVGIRHGIPVFCPIAPDGTMTAEINIQELVNKTIVEVQRWAIEHLEKNNLLFFKTQIIHSYPHCWRCRNGLIFRATKQWFCNLTHDNLQKKALHAIETLTMLPEGSKQQFTSTVASRSEWCLSRQRSWGTPIPAVLCNECLYVKNDYDFILFVANKVKQYGIEWWTRASFNELGFDSDACTECIKGKLIKEKDILDVWFDAGIGHTALFSEKNILEDIDLFIEGKDQHRGYFQSALLTSIALHQKACMKSIITHGFTVDEKGRKMSKSLGNGVEPATLIEKMGIDGVRLWVASVDLASEVVVSEKLLLHVQEVYRKIRNSCRFLLSNLFDFDEKKDRIEVEKILPIDQIGLYQLKNFLSEIEAAYNAYDFTAVFHLLADYTTIQLSSFYLDIIKDRLYVEEKTGLKRRSAQTVCYNILDNITKVMAPILSFTAELISDQYQKNKTESIHLQNFPDNINVSPSYVLLWTELPVLLKIRSILLKAIEMLRQQQIIRHSLEVDLTLYIDPKKIPGWNNFVEQFSRETQSIESFFMEFLIISQVTMIDNNLKEKMLIESDFEGLWFKLKKAEGQKCLRCWQWQKNITHTLCSRCQLLVNKN